MNFENYHFHLYYPINKIEQARNILEKLRSENKYIEIGRVWDRPVGPHPIGSCQVSVTKNNFQEMIEWFFNGREGFSLFIHAVTGDDYLDHTDYVLWMGKEFQLNLEMFKK
jgi:aromatic ring-cleaving dioxygenase